MTTENATTGLQPTTAGETALDTFDDLIADAGRGTENIGANDVRPPRLMLCQSGSPQRKEGNAKLIAGLNELDLFNSLSGEIYGRSLRFTVITSLGSHWVEFNDDLTVADPSVPEGDKRTEWTVGDDGKPVKPIATKFYDYLVWLPDFSELVAFSLKSTQVKVAIKLNGLLILPLKIGGRIIAKPPAWARVYKIETKMEQDKQYSWGGYNLSTDGVTPPDVRALCSELANTYAKVNVVIEREDDAPAEPGAAGDQPQTATGTGDPADM